MFTIKADLGLNHWYSNWHKEAFNKFLKSVIQYMQMLNLHDQH